ncbi:MAG: L-threonylcarbamoyladenylate synthase, partial [Burkholderiales bacterium]
MNYYKAGLLRKVQSHLNRGGVIAYPTEYCFGLGCDPFNYQAINKIIHLKARNKNKGLIVIAGSQQQLVKLVQPFTDEESIAVKQYWPGPFTLLRPVKSTGFISSNLVGKHSKLAVRVTKHKLVQQLCYYLAMPLVSTSANKARFRPITTYRECKRIFGRQVMVLPGITNNTKRPSTIIDWESKHILR